jgi:hypothetical protein
LKTLQNQINNKDLEINELKTQLAQANEKITSDKVKISNAIKALIRLQNKLEHFGAQKNSTFNYESFPAFEFDENFIFNLHGIFLF